MTSTFQRDVGRKTISFETGKLAQKANGSVVVSSGDNVLLITATMAKPREGIDFFPLTIDVEERQYARGKIPGSFFRREGRPSTFSILIARLTDRPIRPLFPKGFKNEVQIIITPLSLDMETPYDTLAVTGASAALSISDIPFDGPISCTRMAYVEGEYIVNPTYEELEESQLDLIVAGSKSGVVMMEAGASEVSEDIVIDAIEKAQEANIQVIELQEELAAGAGKEKRDDYERLGYDPELEDKVSEALGDRVLEALRLGGDESDDALSALKDELNETFGDEYDSRTIGGAFESALDESFRTRIITEGARPDGRGPKEIRQLSAEVSLLPRTHGTGLFSRGETQVLGVCTLGSSGDAQKIDTLSPEESKRFLLHYNFPPYSVGEARRVGSPGRREIGHGALAERALTSVLPSEDEFPYTIRLVGECLSSNGSTSMATVCACTLALMDAGVPIKAPVAGISVGLVTGDNGEYVTLTDIQGLEDHVGDMDFKVAGTRDGITAIQLDIKVDSISGDVIKDALEQAKVGRNQILDVIHEAIPDAREDLSPYAPRMETIHIPVDKIGAVIGPGGKTIRGIVDATKATVDIQDDGSVIIGSADSEASQAAIQMIRDLTRSVEVGEIYTGRVVKCMPFGAFVEILPGRDGMVHISELADYHVPEVEDEVNVGDEITVIVIAIDGDRIRLSRKALMGDEDESEVAERVKTQSQQPSNREPRRDGGGDRDRRGGGGDRRGGDGGGGRSGYRSGGGGGRGRDR
jgi:polyribonucleotide nucleotidyltransferase